MRTMTFMDAVTEAITALEGIRLPECDQDWYMRLTHSLEVLDSMRAYLQENTPAEHEGSDADEHHD